MYTHICICMYTYTHTRIYIYTHTHVSISYYQLLFWYLLMYKMQCQKSQWLKFACDWHLGKDLAWMADFWCPQHQLKWVNWDKGSTSKMASLVWLAICVINHQKVGEWEAHTIHISIIILKSLGAHIPVHLLGLSTADKDSFSIGFCSDL